MKNIKKGFTLIELLVVIAIISLLSSVALASLSSARAKAADANIQGALASARSQAEIFFSSNNDYGPQSTDPNNCSALTPGSLFQADTKFKAIVDSAVAASGVPATSAYCYSSDNNASDTTDAVSWYVSVSLKTDTTKGWCVDSSGSSRRVDMNTVPLFFDGSPAVCPAAI